MPLYRVYVLDERGQFIGGVNFACTDDDAAKAQAKQFAGGRKVKLWRLVAQFKFDNPRDRPAATKRPRARGRRFSHFKEPLKQSYFPWIRLRVLALFRS
ncbi:MAG: hypothetical protein E5W72_04620 [Mesorhizobium sp.]|nr:MAG: hypothetical protein E5W72_04620 [Mesorhizobium sp.]